jgi:hypothetical protein
LALAVDASKSVAKRRFRLSQARVRLFVRRPNARQQLKTGRVSGALNDLDGPFAEFGELQSFTQVEAVVDTVCEKMA